MSTVITTLNSQYHWLADGTQVNWDFAFAGGYISKSHVKAYHESPEGVRTPVTLTNANFIGPFQLSITPAIPAGDKLVIYRDTPKDLPLVDFADGAGVSEASLDLVAKQGVFVAAETADFLGTTTAADLIETAQQAAASAQDAAASAAIASAAVADIPAFVTQAQTSASNAANSASSASLSATNAATSAATASSQASAASGSATLANTRATAAGTSATAAAASATAAATSATNAATSATAAAGSATAAGTSATNAATSAANAAASAASLTVASGTWIPAFESIAGINVSLERSGGIYRRVGSQVTVSADVKLSSKNGITQLPKIINLPFPVINGGSVLITAMAPIQCATIGLGARDFNGLPKPLYIGVYGGAGSTGPDRQTLYYYLWSTDNGFIPTGDVILADRFGDNLSMAFTITYITDAP